MGWNYVFGWVVVLPLEITAAGITVSYWPNNVPLGAWITIFYVGSSTHNLSPLSISEQLCRLRLSRSTFSAHSDTQRSSGHRASSSSLSSCSYLSPSSSTAAVVPRAERIASISAPSIGTTQEHLPTASKASVPSSLPPPLPLRVPSSSVLPRRTPPIHARRCLVR